MSTTFESDWENTRLKERIEELEREVERLNRIKSRTHQVELQSENDALLAHIARLLEALTKERDLRVLGQSPECENIHWKSIRDMRRDMCIDRQTDGALVKGREVMNKPFMTYKEEAESLRDQLTAAQAREAELVAHIDWLRGYLERLACLGNGTRHGNSVGNVLAQEALAATPEQSLARLRNQAIEKCAVELDGHWDMAAGIIRAMKETE